MKTFFVKAIANPRHGGKAATNKFTFNGDVHSLSNEIDKWLNNDDEIGKVDVTVKPFGKNRFTANQKTLLKAESLFL